MSGQRTTVPRLQMGNDGTRGGRRPRLPSGDGKRRNQPLVREPGLRAAVLRRSETRRSSSASADEVGGVERNPRDAERRREQGQATIEFMAMVPLVLAVLVAALQVMILSYTAHAASQAARDGARAYSLDGSATAAARASLPGAISLVNVTTYGPEHGVRVTVEAPPMLFLLDRQVTRSVTMP